jgi:hypothetical protein
MDDVMAIIDGANQRGGRMLSVIDLMEAGTLPLDLASRLIARILRGSSFLVGARPGGAGKTTVMAALLGMLPSRSVIRLADGGTGWRKSLPGETVVAYEIGQGAYQAYVWGEDLRAMAALGMSGARIVSNLHADTVEEARVQVVEQNGIPEPGFAAFQMFLPLVLRQGPSGIERRIGQVSVAEAGTWKPLRTDAALSEEEAGIAAFLEHAAARRIRRIEEVRAAWLQR